MQRNARDEKDRPSFATVFSAKVHFSSPMHPARICGCIVVLLHFFFDTSDQTIPFGCTPFSQSTAPIRDAVEIVAFVASFPLFPLRLPFFFPRRATSLTRCFMWRWFYRGIRPRCCRLIRSFALGSGHVHSSLPLLVLGGRATRILGSLRLMFQLAERLRLRTF